MLIYPLRFILMILWFFGASFLVLLACLARPFHIGNSALFCRVVCPIALRLLGIRLVVNHAEYLSQRTPCVYLANHQHLLDLFIFGAFFPRRTITIGKKSLAWIPVWGWVYALAGNLLIDRSKHERALATMQQAKEALLKKNASVLICPEGTRTHGRGMQPFKKGAFHLALDTGLPLVPFVISSYYGKLRFWRWNAGTVLVECLPPIPTEGLGTAETEALSTLVYGRMKAVLNELDRKILSCS